MDIIEEYDKKSLCSMLLKCHHHLHSLIELESELVNKKIDEDYNLHILGMAFNTSELIKKLVKRKLQIFRWYQANVKDIKCPFK